MALKVIVAAFPSYCTLGEDDIQEGDEIVCIDDEWVHKRCAEEEGYEVD